MRLMTNPTSSSTTVATPSNGITMVLWCSPGRWHFPMLVKQQVQHMSKPNSWGTHLEIYAAATLFRIPVYYCTQSTSDSRYTWGVFNPIVADRITFPVITEDLLLNRTATSHIEMYYHSSVHYDAIVSLQTGATCVTPPELTGTNDPNIVKI